MYPNLPRKLQNYLVDKDVRFVLDNSRTYSNSERLAYAIGAGLQALITIFVVSTFLNIYQASRDVPEFAQEFVVRQDSTAFIYGLVSLFLVARVLRDLFKLFKLYSMPEKFFIATSEEFIVWDLGFMKKFSWNEISKVVEDQAQGRDWLYVYRKPSFFRYKGNRKSYNEFVMKDVMNINSVKQQIQNLIITHKTS